MTMATVSLIAHYPPVAGALGGALTAAKTDFDAFRKWQSFHDAEVYCWSVAAWRWVQGAIVGAVTGAGLSALL